MKIIKYFSFILLLNFHTFAQADIKINNNQITLSFNDTTFALKKITNLTNSSNINFDEEESPIWAVTFIDTDKDSIKVSDLYTRTSFDFSANQNYLIEDNINGKLLTLFWTDIEFNPGDTLEITVTVFLPNGENKSIWNIEVNNNSDRYGTFTVDFPYLAIQPIEETRSNDRLVFPSQSGSLFDDPIGFARMAVHNGSDLTGLANNNEYPGMTGMQFAYLYDHDTKKGLYFATDDTAGYARKTAFYGSEAKNFLYYLVRHYPENNGQINTNYAPPYQVTLQPFEGDWIDAAKYYREWAIQQPWCQQGPLYLRQDFNPDVGESSIFFTVHAADIGGDPGVILSRALDFQTFFGNPQTFIHMRGWWWAYFLVFGIPADDTIIDIMDSLTTAGFRVAPYTSTKDWNPRFFPHEIGDAGVAKNINGDILYQERWDSNVMCAGHSTWQDFYPMRVAEMMEQLGATDIYLDNYPSHRFCYHENHDHPHGGGSHWSRGYKIFMGRIRNNHPGALMGNEGKYEQLIPYLEGFFVPLWTGSGGPTQNDRPFCMPGAFPVPLVQCVYHDYIIPFGSNGARWEEYVPGQYAFEQAFAFVNGNLINVLIQASPLSQYQSKKSEDMKFSRQMAQTFPYAKQYLRYGEWMRPPEVSTPTTTVHFAIDYPMYESIEQPKILSACFKAANGSLGLAFANYTTESVSGTFFVNLENYGLAPGNYSVNIIDTSGVFAFDQFDGSNYSNQLNMPAKSVLIFQIGLSTAVQEADASKTLDFELKQNYPNPFNAETIIRFSLSKQRHIRLKIFNIMGQEISELLNKKMEAEKHIVRFNATKLESGIYFYRLISNDQTSTFKMALVK